MDVLFVDNHLLVVTKPPGVLAQADRMSRQSNRFSAAHWARLTLPLNARVVWAFSYLEARGNQRIPRGCGII